MILRYMQFFHQVTDLTLIRTRIWVKLCVRIVMRRH